MLDTVGTGGPTTAVGGGGNTTTGAGAGTMADAGAGNNEVDDARLPDDTADAGGGLGNAPDGVISSNDRIG